MKYLLCTVFVATLLLNANNCFGQQSKTFGKYAIHYNVINSNQIPAQVAKSYGITRSPSRALVNITVMDMSQGEPGAPLHAKVDTTTINLTGQRRDVEMREITEGDEAVYYIGELPVHNMETYNFTVTVHLEGERQPFELKFRQQFYTE